MTSTNPAAIRGPFLVLGRAGMDFYAEPVGTALENATAFQACLGGSSGNIAVGLARLGCDVSLLSVVSDDAVGQFTLNALANAGVSSRYCRVLRGEARTTLAVVDTCGDATKAVIYRNGAADFQLGRDDIEAVDFSAFGTLVVTGTALAANPSRDAVFLALEKADAAGLSRVLDVDYRPYSWDSPDDASDLAIAAAEACNLVVGNDVEFGVMAGGGGPEGLALARKLGRGGRMVIYKMGADGSIALADGLDEKSGIFSVTALKPTGAGDSYLSAYLAARASGHDHTTAQLHGSASAAIVVGRVGCSAAMPRPQELSDFIAANPAPVTG